jgi:hypothetical protein
MRTITFAIFSLLVLNASVAAADDYAVKGKVLTITPAEGDPSEVALTCAGNKVFVHKGLAYVACGPSGAAVVDLAGTPPAEIARRDMGGAVSDFFVVNDRVWAQIHTVEARPVAQGDIVGSQIVFVPGATTPAPVKADPKNTEDEPAARPEAEVIAIRADDVIVGLGSDHGIKRNDHIEIFLRTEVEFGGESTNKEELVLVGKVTAVSATRCEVKLGINERVPPGALARPTTGRLTSNRVAPPRLGHLWEFGFTLRPFLALGTFGFGTISDATIRRRFDNPYSLELRIEPLGIGFADEGNIVAASGNLLGSYDTRLFSVGLGLGWAAINDSVEDSFGSNLDSEGTPVRFERVRSGFSLAQSVRLGAQDGLHLAVYNSFLFFREQFNYGGTTVSLQFPAGDALWVFARGGGGAATGYGFGEVGLRVRLLGAGDSGSLFLSPSVGGGGLFGEKDCDDYENCVEDISYGGPLVGLGVEWRQ